MFSGVLRGSSQAVQHGACVVGPESRMRGKCTMWHRRATPQTLGSLHIWFSITFCLLHIQNLPIVIPLFFKPHIQLHGIMGLQIKFKMLGHFLFLKMHCRFKHHVDISPTVTRWQQWSKHMNFWNHLWKTHNKKPAKWLQLLEIYSMK